MDILTHVRLETLTPYHYQALAIPSGVASIATHMADRSVAYGLAAALGGLRTSGVTPIKGYLRDFARMPWMASMFEAVEPKLMRPQGRRLTLDHEGGYSKRIQEATGTGNLKSWFYIQEIPPGTLYHGAVYGKDPFLVAAKAEGQPVNSLVFRVGRQRQGLVRMTRAKEQKSVRLNLHTGYICGADMQAPDAPALGVPLLWDIQVSEAIESKKAAAILNRWRETARGLEYVVEEAA